MGSPPPRARHLVATSVLVLALIGTVALRLSAPDVSMALNPDAIDSPCALRTPDMLGESLSVNVVPDDEVAFHDVLYAEVAAFQSAESFWDYTIPRSAKQSVPATLTFEWEGSSCTTRGEISLSGDWADHLGVRDNGDGTVVAQPSFDVALDHGIGQFHEFKLFTTGTKFFSGEILTSEILTALGYLAPRNQVVTVHFAGETYEALMQDKISGELLEVRSRQNGPVIETDERIFWGEFGNFKFAAPFRVRNVNKDFVKGGGSSGALIVGEAIARLQAAVDEAQFAGWNGRDLDLTELDSSARWNLDGSLNRMEMFPLIMYAIRGEHGLNFHNRSFYYNPVLGTFEPIYYDGNVMLTPEAWWSEEALTEIRNSTQTDPMLKVDTTELQANLESLRNELRTTVGGRIDFIKNIFGSGYRPEDYVDRAIDSMLGYLTAIGESSSIDFEPLKNLNPADWPSDTAAYDVVHLTLSEQILGSGRRIPAVSCSGVDQCEDIKVKISELPNLLADRRGEREFVEVTIEDTPEITLRDTDFGLYTIGSVGYERTGNSLNFELRDERARVVFMGSNLENVDIQVRSMGGLMKNPPAEHEINQFGLTGCVELLFSTINNTSISLVGSTCEDGIHIANSTGEHNTLSVDQALADAVDIDRSEIQFDTASVHVAANDCLDFSDSVIKVDIASLTNCGDKMVSIGERATVELLFVEGTGNLGLVAKDLADLRVGIAQIATDSRCTDTYQKKEIFGPGNLAVARLTCDGNSAASS